MRNQHQQKPAAERTRIHHAQDDERDVVQRAESKRALMFSPTTIMRLQRTIGNQAVLRLVGGGQTQPSAPTDHIAQHDRRQLTVQHTDSKAIQRDDALANPSALWTQVSDGYHAFIGKLGAANQKSPTVTRSQWVNDLGEQWAKVGAPGQKSDAELRQLADILKQYKATAKAENDQAQAYWKELRVLYGEDKVWERTEVWAEYARKLFKETFIETRRRVNEVGDVLTFEDLAQLEDRIVRRTHETSAEKRQYDIDNPPKRKQPPGFTKFKLRMLAGGELSAGPVGGTVQTYSLEELGPNGRTGAITFTAVGASGGAKAGGGFYSTASEFSTSVPMRLEDFAGGGRIASGGLGPASYSVVVFYAGNKPTVEVKGFAASFAIVAGASWMHGIWELRSIY